MMCINCYSLFVVFQKFSMKWAIFLYGTLEDIARGRSDGDDVGACW